MAARGSPKASLSKQASWLFLAKTIGYAIMLGVPMLVARAFDQSTYGLYRQATLLLSTGILILPFGYIFSAYYYFPLGPDRRLAAAWNVVLFLAGAGTVALATLSVHPRIVEWLLGGNELVPYARLLGVIVFLQCIGYPLEHFAIADGQIRLSTAVILAIQLSRGALLYGVALFAPSLRNLLWAIAAQAFLQAAAFSSYMWTSFRRCWLWFDRRFFVEQFIYVLPMGLTALVYIFQVKIPSYIVARQYAPAIFAIFAVGCFEVPFIGVVREALGAVMIPRISELKFHGDFAEIRRITAVASGKLAIANFAFIGAFLACGPDFIRFLFSSRYSASWPIFVVNLTPWVIEIFLTDPIGRAFPDVQRKLLAARIVVVALATSVMLAYGARYGLVFIASVQVFFFGVERLYALWLAAVRTGFKSVEVPLWSTLPLAGLAAAGGVVGGRLVHHALNGWPIIIRLAGCTTTFLFVYVFLLWTTKSITADDISKLRQLLPGSAIEPSIEEEKEELEVVLD